MGTPDDKPNLTPEQLQKPLRVKDITGIMKAIADVIRPLEARIAALEARPIPKYLGTFEAGRVYHEGSMITDHGSIWHCNRATMTRPGDGAADWVLAVKRGRDADERRLAKSHR